MSDHKERSTQDLDAELVAQFLRENPTFFLRRDDLLAEMRLPHPSGGAISLMEKQVSILRERNMEMRHRLTRLLENARDNDILFEKSKHLVLCLLEARNLDELLRTTEDSLLRDFGVDFCSLTLFSNTRKLRAAGCRVVAPSEARRHIGAIMDNSKAVCGILRQEELDFLFPAGAGEVGSAAVNPLGYGYPVGILAIGSKDANYYRSSMGTVFLNYISEVLNRLLPRHLPPELISE